MKLLPTDPHTSWTYVIGQDSPYKGVRFENAFYQSDGQVWRMGGHTYSADELAENRWEIVEQGEFT